MIVRRMIAKMARLYTNCKQWIPTDQEWIKAMACVQPEESDRINQFVFQEDAKRSLVGRLLARRFLVDLFQCTNLNLKLKRTAYGKPYLAGVESHQHLALSVDFSVSHQGDYAVFAGQENCIIGTDVMDIVHPHPQSVSELFHLMRRQFTSVEWEYIKHPQEELEQLSRFYRIWCLKEGYVKALGRGIGFGVERITCHPCSRWSPDAVTMGTRVTVDGQSLDGWAVEESFIDSRHCVAVVVKPNHPQSWEPRQFTEISVPALLAGMETVQEPLQHNWTLFSRRDRKS